MVNVIRPTPVGCSPRPSIYESVNDTTGHPAAKLEWIIDRSTYVAARLKKAAALAC